MHACQGQRQDRRCIGEEENPSHQQDSRRGRDSRSETKASRSMELTARNVTDLNGLGGEMILSEH